MVQHFKSWTPVLGFSGSTTSKCSSINAARRSKLMACLLSTVKIFLELLCAIWICWFICLTFKSSSSMMIKMKRTVIQWKVLWHNYLINQAKLVLLPTKHITASHNTNFVAYTLLLIMWVLYRNIHRFRVQEVNKFRESNFCISRFLFHLFPSHDFDAVTYLLLYTVESVVMVTTIRGAWLRLLFL